MKLDENIRAYRKGLNISQEELGKMLFVSRQTVSMWEKGQTVPTIDNLTRLAEIFSVSVDELLREEEKPQSDQESERYSFHFSGEEIREIQRPQKTKILKSTILFGILMVLLLRASVLGEAKDTMWGFTIGIFLIGAIYHLKTILAYQKVWKRGAARLAESTYQYEIMEDSFKIDILRSGRSTESYTAKFQDIEKVQELPNYYILQIFGRLFILRKSDLKENSVFYSYLYHMTAKQPVPDTWKTASITLFVLSLCSILLGLTLTGYASTKNGLFTENMWVFYTVTPIPISSIIFGFLAKRRGYPWKKNIIGGIIMTALLCVYGSFVFMI